VLLVFYKNVVWLSQIKLSITSKKLVTKLIQNLLNMNIASKRRIEIAKLFGITKSLSESTGEFVLHIRGEYDYRMKSDNRD
jgi:hypothetical protein